MIPPGPVYRNTYALVLARTLDILACGWIWRVYGVTISSECGLALRKPAPPPGAYGPRAARALGRALNWIEPGHCEGAIAADIARARQALSLLGSP